MKIGKFIILIFILSLIFSGGIEAEESDTEYINLPNSENGEKTKMKLAELKWKEGEIVSPTEGDNLLQFRGIDFYPYPESYSWEGTIKSLESLLRIEEVNWIQLRFFLYQDNKKSNGVRIDKSQDKRLIEMIEMIHKSGRKVSLEPHLVVDSYNSWAGAIDSESTEKWFNSYRKALLYYAKIAQENDVELFPIANEYITVWKYNKEWTKTIELIRQNYDGELTIKLNAWWQSDYLEKVLEWKWMSKLDYIGMSPYFDLIRKKDVTLEELRQSWIETYHGLNIVESLEKISKEFNTDIIFLEIGYRSVTGTAIEPWNYRKNIPNNSDTEAVPNQEAQVLATQALFDVFVEKEWFRGVFWFYWPTKIIIDPKDTGWSIPGKEVEEVIWKNFRKEN